MTELECYMVLYGDYFTFFEGSSVREHFKKHDARLHEEWLRA